MTHSPVRLAAGAWMKFRDDPVLMRRLNGWLTIFWLVAIPVSYAAGWLQSVTYVSALSLWALVAGHMSTWQAARVETKQKEQEESGELEDRVVDRIVERTGIEESPEERGRFW